MDKLVTLDPGLMLWTIITFLALVAKRGQLAGGAPTENANTGRVWFFDLR